MQNEERVLIRSRQIRPSALSSQCLPIRNRLPLDLERRGGLETSNHDQADLVGHPGLAERSQSRLASPG